MKNDIRIICVDFDGTIVEHSYPDIGNPKNDAFEVLSELKDAGCKVILWTCREGETLENAVEFCKQHGLEFDAVNEAIDDFRCSGLKRKPFADYYIDDRNIGGLPDWETIREILFSPDPDLEIEKLKNLYESDKSD